MHFFLGVALNLFMQVIMYEFSVFCYCIPIVVGVVFKHIAEKIDGTYVTSLNIET